MKKALITLAMAVLTVTAAMGQESGKSTDEFHGHWFIGIQGGIGQTVGETSFGDLISPAAGINFGYRFTPVWGLRAGIGGWQAKGAVVGPTEVYKYNYLQGSVDVMVDLCNRRRNGGPVQHLRRLPDVTYPESIPVRRSGCERSLQQHRGTGSCSPFPC